MSGYVGNDGSALAGGLNPSSVVQGLAVDAAGRLLTANYIGGAAVGNTNPYPSADQIRLMILAGMGYSATTGVLSSATNGNLYGGMGLFNNATAKNMLIYSILLSVSNNAFDSRLNLTSADPAMGSALSAYNLSPGGAASLATLSAPANNFTASVGITGNSIEAGGGQANTLVEWLQNGACVLLPKNAANGIAVYTKLVTAGNSFSVTIRWVEY